MCRDKSPRQVFVVQLEEARSVESPLAAKGLLRHADLATTTKHYVKRYPEGRRAMDKIDQLFDNHPDERPN